MVNNTGAGIPTSTAGFDSLLNEFQTAPARPAFNSPLGVNSLFYIPQIALKNDNTGGLFPGQGFSAGTSLDASSLFENQNNDDDPKITIWLTFLGFDSEAILESFLSGNKVQGYSLTINEFLENNAGEMPLQIICAYVKKTGVSSSPLPVFRYSSGFCGYVNTILSRKSATDIYEHIDSWKKRVIELGAPKNGFRYEDWQIKDAFESTLLTDINSLHGGSSSGSAREKKELYEKNFKHFRAFAENPDDPQTENAIRLLCKVIADLDADVLKSYNQQNDVVYDTAYPTRKLIANDYYHMARRLSVLASEISKFQNGHFETADDVRSFVNDYLVDKSSIGAETKFIINYPFSKLTYERRKQIISLFLDGSSSLGFSGFLRHTFKGNYISYGDVVFNLFNTASKEDLAKLMTALDAENKLFDLMQQSDEEFLQHMVLFMSDAALKDNTTDADAGLKMIQGIASGNFFFYNKSGDRSQISYLGGRNKKIHIENYGLKFNLDEEEYPGSQSTDDYQGSEGFTANREEEEKEKWRQEKLAEYHAKNDEYLQQFSSPKKEFSPLDLILVVAESEIDNPLLKLKQDEMAMVPACLLYAVMHHDMQVKINFLVSVSLFLIFLPLDYLALANALRTANTLGVMAYRTDIVVGGINVVASTPLVQEGMPEVAETMNYFTFFYGLARFGYSAGKGISAIPNSNLVKALRVIAAETNTFIKAFPYKVAGFLINLQKTEVQMAVLNKLLVVFASDGKVLFKLNPEGIIVEMKLVTGAKDWKPIAELKNAKIKVAALNGKVVEEHVILMKTTDNGKIVLKLATPFEAGKQRPAELINQFFYKSAETPPSMPRTTAVDIYLKEGDSFYVVEFLGQKKPGGFAAAEPVYSIADLRNKLAVLKKWKDEAEGTLVIRKYTVQPGQKVPVRQSIIGPQEEIINGVTKKYKGGPLQYNFLDNYTGVRGEANNWETLFKEQKSFMKQLK